MFNTGPRSMSIKSELVRFKVPKQLLYQVAWS